MDLTADNNFPENFLQLLPDEEITTVYTLPNQEVRLKSFCDDNGIPSYLPLKRVWKHKTVSAKSTGTDYSYKHIVLRPMFPNYMFVRLRKEQHPLFWKSKCLIRLCSMPESYTPLLLKEIGIIRRFELIGMEQELLINPEIHEGDRFRIENGEWEGSYGWLIRKKKKFFWMIHIECLDGYIAATINPADYKLAPAPLIAP